MIVHLVVFLGVFLGFSACTDLAAMEHERSICEFEICPLDHKHLSSKVYLNCGHNICRVCMVWWYAQWNGCEDDVCLSCPVCATHFNEHLYETVLPRYGLTEKMKHQARVWRQIRRPLFALSPLCAEDGEHNKTRYVLGCKHAFCTLCLIWWYAHAYEEQNDCLWKSCPLCAEIFSTQDKNALSKYKTYADWKIDLFAAIDILRNESPLEKLRSYTKFWSKFNERYERLLWPNVQYVPFKSNAPMRSVSLLDKVADSSVKIDFDFDDSDEGLDS